MRRRLAVAALAIGASGCAASGEPSPPTVPQAAAQPVAEAGMSPGEAEFRRRYMSCTLEPLGIYVGKVLTADLKRTIAERSQAASVWVVSGAGDMSLEGEPGRLTITIDGNSRITHFACE